MSWMEKGLRPMLAQTAPHPFDSEDHIFEIKWDGTRCLAFLSKKTRLQNRRLMNITYRYPELNGLYKAVNAKEAILDGELVVFSDGRPNFNLLQRRDHEESPQKIKQLSKIYPATFVAFDIVYLNGMILTERPLWERKQILKDIIKDSPLILVTDFIKRDGKRYFSLIREAGLEGIMAKEINSPYLFGKRSKYWLKIKTKGTMVCYVCGYTIGKGERERTFGALLLATQEDNVYLYRGRVGTGFTYERQIELLSLLRPLTCKRPPPLRNFEPFPLRIVWVRPKVRVLVEFKEITEKGHLRAPSFKGIVNG